MNIPPGFCQVNLYFTGAAAPRGAQIVFGCSNEDGDPLASVAAAFASEWGADCLVLQAPAITLDKVRVKAGPNDTGPYFDFPVGEDGGNSGSAVEPQVALIVKKTTALGGRANQGRSFVPGLVDDAFDGSGRVAPASLTAWQTALSNFRGALATAGYPLFLLHTSDEVAPTAINDLRVETLAATQRRRIRKVGGRRRSPTP